jgi:hypothetical protein
MTPQCHHAALDPQPFRRSGVVFVAVLVASSPLAIASFGRQRRKRVSAVRTFALFGRSRRSDVRVVRAFALFARQRRSGVSAVRTFAPSLQFAPFI